MASRYSAARPKRAGEAYARAHHAETASDSKKVKFDVRNPSALLLDAEDGDEGPDAYLEADEDVIRGGAATKRGAVNIDGYDSDSDREELGAKRAEPKPDKNGDDVDDMFADDGDAKDDKADLSTGKKSKEVRFLDHDEIEGQDLRSKGGGHVRLDDESDDDDDDEEAIASAVQEEDVDEEVGAGGLKKHAPKVEAFNLKAEEEEGRFDESGNFVRKAADKDDLHDRWLEGLSKKEMKKAAEAHEKREAESRQKRREDDDILTSDLLKRLILQLEPTETALEALARLAKRQTKPKKLPKWKAKKQKQKDDVMDVDAEKEAEDPEQTRIKEAIDAITDAADKLLGRERPDIYDRERELLIREWSRETQERWVEPEREKTADPAKKMWEFRWTDGRDDAAKQGPYDGSMMKAWQDAGYFGEGVEFREVGDEDWTRVVSFTRKAKEPSQEPADGSSWKAEEERDLLLFLFAVGNVTNRIVGNGKGRITAWPVVCKLFTDKGYSRTRNALQTRWTRDLLPKIGQFDNIIEGCLDEIEAAIRKAQEDADALENQRSEQRAKISGGKDTPVSQGDVEDRICLENNQALRHGSDRINRFNKAGSSLSNTAGPAVSNHSFDNANGRGRAKKGKGKEKAVEDQSVKFLEFPKTVDLSDLLPIVDMSGTIRGFITASPNLVGPDPATFAPTTLVSAIQQYPHEAVTIQARLLAGDAPLLRSISSQPEHDEEPFQTSRSDRNISSAGYHQGQAMDPSNTGLSSLKSVADDQSGHYDLVQAPSDGAPYVTQTQCGGHASMFPNELVDQHLEEGTNNSYPELDRLLNQENNPYPDPDNLSQLFQSDYIFSDDAFTRPKPAGTDCFDNAGGSYRHEDKQDH